MLSTHKTITLALMCALASTTVLTGCKDGAQQRQAAQRQMREAESERLRRRLQALREHKEGGSEK